VLDDIEYFIPDEEIMVIDHTKTMKPDGRKISDEDYYIWDKVYARANSPRHVGGFGIPCWIYHPGAPNWIFLAGALPILGLGAIIKRQLK
jgi:hypothetical protein